MVNIDIISKGVYTPCNSRIKIGNFICPTWQLEGEKILHDNKNFFLYQKHSKMRVLKYTCFLYTLYCNTITFKKREKIWFFNTINSIKFF